MYRSAAFLVCQAVMNPQLSSGLVFCGLLFMEGVYSKYPGAVGGAAPNFPGGPHGPGFSVRRGKALLHDMQRFIREGDGDGATSGAVQF